MYIPAAFREERVEVLQAMMQRHRFATLVTLGDAGLQATHLPLLFYPGEGTLGVLRGHVARANAQWHNSVSTVEALTIFQGPSAYISPQWYATKREHGRVVPTYNYVAVHAYGPLRTFEESERLLEVVRGLTGLYEADFEVAWRVEDAPEAFVEAQLRGIVGIEIPISRLEGKWKMSQNRSDEDRSGVVMGLQSGGTPDQLGVAQLCEFME